MIKKLLFIFILLLTGCYSTTKTKEVVKQEKKSEIVKIFNLDVINLKSELELEKLELSWDLPETKEIKEIKEIRIYRKKSESKKFSKKYTLNAEAKSQSIKMPPFITLEFKIVLVGNDGSESLGKIVKVTGEHKSVIMDKYEGREMQIYLPPSYKTDSKKRYPVIYAHDGQNMFDFITAPNGEWKVDETMDKLIAEGVIEEMIVVAVYNSSNRAFEYVPYQDQYVNDGEPSGAKAYADFLVKGIIPYIDGKYRTIANRENRAIMGSSFGGISALWTGFTYSDTFSKIGAVSPSLWVGDMKIFEEIEKAEKKDLKIWFDRGTLEWTVRERILIKIMTEKGYRFGQDIVYYEAKDRLHNEEAWAERMPYILNFFGGIKEGKVVKIEPQIEIAINYEEKIFKVINVMVDYNNGMRNSAYLDAEFEILNGAGTIDKDGFFEFNGTEDIDLLVKAYGMKEKITIKYSEVEEMLKNLKN